jgi:TRAP transporter 4TM/12TM fusion protein
MPLYNGGFSQEMVFLGTHLGAAIGITFLIFGLTGRRPHDAPVPFHDVALAVAALACAGYLVGQGERMATRIPGVDNVFLTDQIVGTLFILLLLESCRRVAGLVLTAIAVLFIAFLFLGPYLPTAISYSGLSFKRFIDLQVLSTNAIFGSPLSASAHMVFYFLIVGAFLERSGAGQLFVNAAYGLTSRLWGGAGKAAIVSSGLLGMINGSAVANVLLSGIMTIPLMKRSGFKATMAGAIEATASTGGQLSPPIMGAAAFILADISGVPYAEVALAALVPALLYYTSLYTVIHCYSLRNNLAPDTRMQIGEHLAGMKQRWHLLLPIVFMVFLLIERYSLLTVGAYTTVAIIAVSMFRSATRMSPASILEALVNGAKSACEVAIPSAVAGIVVGSLVQTGLALRMQRWLLDIAGDSLLMSLVGAMVLTIILGMGMPTAAAYLISAILIAPALVELGIPVLSAHLFLLYFGILSMVTPPVALSAYAAAGISGANMWRTGVVSFALAIPGFIIPFAFAFNPALILQGEFAEIVLVIGAALAGVLATGAALGGYLLGPLSTPVRFILFVAAPFLIAPDIQSDLVGAAIALAVVGFQIARRKFGINAPSDTAGNKIS